VLQGLRYRQGLRQLVHAQGLHLPQRERVRVQRFGSVPQLGTEPGR
jgi:hypothetical protein